jgi:peptide/nickel transport system substrate-binding protein
MSDQKRDWKKLQKPNFDRKKIARRVKKAESATVRHAHKFIVRRLDNIRSVRRHVIGWLVLVGCMIGLVGLQMMWFQQSYQTSVAASGGTFAEATLGPIDTLNPLYASSSAEISASHLLFSSLFTYDTTGHLQGDLAESMHVDTSGTVYTVKLRQNTLWHDGTVLNAKDVAFTVNLIKDPATRSPLRMNWQDVKVKTVDNETVQFTLPAVYAAFPHALTFAVLPQHILGSVTPGTIRENVFSRSPIGSGPFSLRLLQAVSSQPEHKVVNMIAFDKYYRGAPKLSRFELHAYGTQDAILSALRSGQVNAAADLNGSDIAQVDTRAYTVSSQPINSGVYALLNVDAPVLKDVAVRRALQLATNTPQIRKSLTDKVAPLDLPFVNGQLTGDDVPHAATFDSKKAGELLDSAGWKLVDGVRKKDGQPLVLRIATTKNAQYEKALETLASQWRQLGVTVNTNVADTGDPTNSFVRNVLQARNYDVLLYELSIGADPDVYAYWHSSQIGVGGYNFSNYVNKSADSTLASARSRLEPELRNAKYKAFARQWLDDVPAIGLYQPVADYAMNKHVSAITPEKLITSYDRYANILYWSVEQRSVYKTP